MSYCQPSSTVRDLLEWDTLVSEEFDLTGHWRREWRIVGSQFRQCLSAALFHAGLDGATTPYLYHACRTCRHLRLAGFTWWPASISRLQDVGHLYFNFDCYVGPRNLFRVVWVLSSLWSIYRNIPMTQPRTMSKPTSSFNTFLADPLPENGEGEACAVGLRLPVAQRMLFDCFRPDNWLAVGAEPVKPR